jgi:hypothetical protein
MNVRNDLGTENQSRANVNIGATAISDFCARFRTIESRRHQTANSVIMQNGIPPERAMKCASCNKFIRRLTRVFNERFSMTILCMLMWGMLIGRRVETILKLQNYGVKMSRLGKL